MSERVILVRRTPCHVETNQCDDGRCRVRKVIEGICGDGNGPCENPRSQFPCKEKYIAEYTHCSSHCAIGLTDFMVF